ncbi:MAG: HD domain-containing phosphohydrolase [Sulfuricellaceae bacterium]
MSTEKSLIPAATLEPASLAATLAASGDQREQLLAALRHELRTPMNHIIGYSEMLIEDATELGRDYLIRDLGKIHRAGQRLLALVNDLCTPHKLESSLQHGLQEARHDMRTFVNHIIGFSEMLQEEANALSEASFITDLGKIQDAAKRLLSLIDGSAESLQKAVLPAASYPPALGRESVKVGAQTEQCGSILVVDDDDANRDMLSRRLERLGHSVSTAADGRSALEIMTSARIDLVLLDVMMPEMDGHEMLSRIKSDDALRHIPVIMISALDEIGSIVRCIEAGAEDYIPKPFDPVLLRARIGASLEKKRLRDQEAVYRHQIEEYNLHLEERVKEQVGIITQAQMETIFALSKLAESRDPETGAHLERMREYCKLLAVTLSKTSRYAQLIDSDYVENLYIASPLHDIGKVGIPDPILLKPGRLSAEEFDIMKTHAARGAETLRAVNQKNNNNSFVRIGIEIAESHHEKWDGTGYPHGLAGNAIPLSGRILALADVYDALRSKRCYKESFSHEKSRSIILEGNGKHFDPDVVACFLEVETEFATIWRDTNIDNE